jgi:hypothetical protein
MMPATASFWDILSQDEADFVQTILLELANQPWAQPIVAGINDNGGLTRENKDRLFELRFAYALHRAGIAPRYEILGEGKSTIDFGFASQGQPWAVELLRLGETQAAKAATGHTIDEHGIAWSGRVLSTVAEDPKQSTEGETLKGVERICQKCERGGQPYKFPVSREAYHMILVDFRSFLNGGDVYDRLHIALGAESVAPQYRLTWQGQPISGVFSARTAVRGATEVRDRVHFLGFVRERAYKPDEFGAVLDLVASPLLFSDAAAVRAAGATWPLQPVRILNAPD